MFNVLFFERLNRHGRFLILAPARLSAWHRLWSVPTSSINVSVILKPLMRAAVETKHHKTFVLLDTVSARFPVPA